VNEIIRQLISNRTLVSACSAWLVAQVIKTILYLIVNKTFDVSRLFGDGGMPSGHSATVTALATRAAMEYGLSSSIFAISAVLAIIVMHDAMGVRRESGRHAQALNEIMLLLGDDMDFDMKLKEFLGHSPSQVVVGAILGLVVGLIGGAA